MLVTEGSWEFFQNNSSFTFEMDGFLSVPGGPIFHHSKNLNATTITCAGLADGFAPRRGVSTASIVSRVPVALACLHMMPNSSAPREPGPIRVSAYITSVCVLREAEWYQPLKEDPRMPRLAEASPVSCGCYYLAHLLPWCFPLPLSKVDSQRYVSFAASGGRP